MNAPDPTPEDAAPLRVVRAETLEAGAEAAARLLAEAASEAVAAGRRFALALPGGSSPLPVYRLLAAGGPMHAAIPWAETEVFFVDERCVPPEHAESNFRSAREHLLDRVPVAPEHVHRMRGELPPAEAAEAYAAVLADRLPASPDGLPILDCALLGLGEDGHVASLFPNAPTLDPDAPEQHRPVLAVRDAPKPPPDRITLSLATLNAARRAVLLAFGPGKAEAVRRLVHEPRTPALPASLLRPANKLVLVADGAALSA